MPLVERMNPLDWSQESEACNAEMVTDGTENCWVGPRTTNGF